MSILPYLLARKHNTLHSTTRSSAIFIHIFILKTLNVNILVTAWARKLKFLAKVVVQSWNDRGKTHPKIGFQSPKNKNLEGYNSKTVWARNWKFGVQIATEGDYLKQDLERNRMKTDETRRGFPFLDVLTGLGPSYLYYLSTNFSQVILSFNHLLANINYLLTS